MHGLHLALNRLVSDKVSIDISTTMFKTRLTLKEVFLFLVAFMVTTLLAMIVLTPNVKVMEGQTEKSSLSASLYEQVKVLCLVATSPANHQTKAIHVKNTWGKRCNKLLFVTSKLDPDLDTLLVPVEESRDILSIKTQQSFMHAHDHYLNDYDWFLKADDDNYIIMENLRYMLYQYHSYIALYFGHRFTSSWANFNEGYMSGGGYVLSKKALVKLAKIVRNGTKNSFPKGTSEDLEMGRALDHAAILVDCRDEKHQKRFFPIGIDGVLSKPDYTFWYHKNSYYNVTTKNLNCCSEKPIAFHYISPRELYFLEYAIYNVHPFGLASSGPQSLPKKLQLNEIIAATDEKSFAPSFVEHRDFHNITSSEMQETDPSKSTKKEK